MKFAEILSSATLRTSDFNEVTETMAYKPSGGDLQWPVAVDGFSVSSSASRASITLFHVSNIMP